MTRELLQQALEALNGSVDLVRNEYESNWRHGIPTRKSQLDSYKHDLEVHEKAISDIRLEIAKPVPEHLLNNVEWQHLGPSQQESKPDQWAPFLKDGETPFERFMRERADLDALMTLHRRTLEAQQERKPMTYEEIDSAWRSVDYTLPYDVEFRTAVVREIEAHHDIK